MKKLFKNLGLVLMLAVSAATFTASAQLAQTPFNGSFLAGNYLTIPNTNAFLSTLQTNLYAGTNVWVKGGISITNGSTFSPNYGALTITNTSAFSDVGLWYDRDGTPPAFAINAVLHGQTAIATNTLTFTFASLTRGVANTSAQNTFTFTMSANGTALVGLSTNLPTTFLQGAHGLRCTQITSGNGTNVYLDYLDLKGFKP